MSTSDTQRSSLSVDISTLHDRILADPGTGAVISYRTAHWILNDADMRTLQSWDLTSAPSIAAFTDFIRTRTRLPSFASHPASVPCYIPNRDMIVMPPTSDFIGPYSFYSVLMHELTHSTGHKDRLARKTLYMTPFFRDAHAIEECVAEMGSAILCSRVDRLTPYRARHSISYISHYLRCGFPHETKDGLSEILTEIEGHAQKAADWLYHPTTHSGAPWWLRSGGPYV